MIEETNVTVGNSSGNNSTGANSTGANKAALNLTTTACYLLIGPTDFKPMGAKEVNDEYWILGAQFLQNYYTLYNW